MKRSCELSKNTPGLGAQGSREDGGIRKRAEETGKISRH